MLAHGGGHHRPLTSWPQGCYPLKPCGTKGSHLHWSVVHKAFTNFKRHHSQKPADGTDVGLWALSVEVCAVDLKIWRLLRIERFHTTRGFHSVFLISSSIHFAYLKFACKYICWYNAKVAKWTSQTCVCFNQHPCFIHSMVSSSWRKRGR